MTSHPLSAEEVFAGRTAIEWIRRLEGGLLWVETRPAEARAVLVRWRPGRAPEDLTPEGSGCSNRVGYGGIPYAVGPGGEILSCDANDGRVHSTMRRRPVTPDVDEQELRWADFVVSGEHLYAVREHHPHDAPPTSHLVRVSLEDPDDCVVLDGGHDFVGAPRVSPDGTRLAWLTWDHPQMPWDGTDLWVADLTPAGIGAPVHVAGGPDESVLEPVWTPGGQLLFHSDASGWWNLRRWDPASPRTSPEQLVSMDHDMCLPYWTLGLRTMDVLADGRVVCTWTDQAAEHLGVWNPDGRLVEVPTPYTRLGSPTVVGDRVAVVAGSPTQAPAVVLLDLDTGGAGEVLRETVAAVPADVALPQHVTFPTTDGAVAHGFWYPPSVPVDGPAPLIVNCHGGPTAHVFPVLDLRQQFWTSRGYGYLEVNFRGSTGYGRAYRNALREGWGVVDVDDAVSGAEHLVQQGLADPDRLVVRGLSGGGWLTLCAMAFRDVFAAGGSSNGVADALKMAAETHRFESRYLDSLLGPLPECEERYVERSPITAADRITAPLILIQGADDDVVPADQAEMIAAALRRRGVPHEHHVYAGEGHLFSSASNLAHALDAEADFFARMLARVETGAARG